MSARTQEAQSDFAVAMVDPHNLISLHQHSQSGQGRRHRETTLNRAVIVLTAAAWQAYMQDSARAILADLAISHGSPGYAQYAVLRANTQNSLRRFNTPNARNSVNLLLDLGFDPQPSWTFVVGTPPRPYNVAAVRGEIDDWLDVRHAIAHGFALPMKQVLTGMTKTGPSIRRNDAERCIAFFEQVVAVTAAAADSQFP
jgi:hypothetical protein